jgi:ankyrin repeat protein
MTSSLPPNASLENLRKQAKTLKKAWQSGDAAALERIRAVHPRHLHRSSEAMRAARPRLADCQLVLARECGFASWPQLKVAVESTQGDLSEQFLFLACLCYNDPHYDHRSFHARAHELLRANSWIAAADIWCASAAGDRAAVEAFLDADPDLVNRPGPLGWPPLICACYSRVAPVAPAHSTFEVAKLLLDRHADPNAYVMKRNADQRLDQTPLRFTALTGVFGGGDTGLVNQPPHSRWPELAELLLDRGANPADEIALQLTQANTAAGLEILLRHGLGPDARAKGISLMGRALAQAAQRGDLERVNLLVAHHARADELWNEKTAWQHATARGHLEIAAILEQARAPVAKLSDVDRFVSLCLSGRQREVRAMLAEAPDLPARAPRNLVKRAVSSGRTEAVVLALDLGFDPNLIDDNAAIHHAGDLASHPEILRILLARGASLKLRDPWYDSTGIGWADFFDYRDLRDKLLDEPEICLFDALDYGRLDRVADILARDPEALERPFAKCLSREPAPADWQTPLVRMVDRGKTEAVRVLLQNGADVTAASHPDRRPLLELARESGHEEIARLLENHGADHGV